MLSPTVFIKYSSLWKLKISPFCRMKPLLMPYGWSTKLTKIAPSIYLNLSRISFEDIFNAAFLKSYPTSDLSAPSIGWFYDISFHIITFKYDIFLDSADQNIQIYLLVPPSEENLVTINR